MTLTAAPSAPHSSAPLASAPSRASSVARQWARRGGYLLTLVMLLAVAAGWPTQFGGRTGYTVVSGHSMDPTYATGDLLVTRRLPDYRIGQVVVYRVPEGEPAAGYYVVHRLTGGGDSTGWTTRGDNNPSEDVWTPHDVDIQGSTVLRIPRGGYLLQQTHNPLLYALLGGLYIGRLLWPRGQADGRPAPGRPAARPDRRRRRGWLRASPCV